MFSLVLGLSDLKVQTNFLLRKIRSKRSDQFLGLEKSDLKNQINFWVFKEIFDRH